MNTLEEQLWNFIDGSCSAAEQETISQLIDQDENYRDRYLALLKLNQEFAAMELDEPPMALTYNVMETIRAEYTRKPLKTTVNYGLIKGIAGFFLIIILALIIFLLANVHLPATDIAIQLPDFKKYFSGPALQCFGFADIILALFFLDTLLRKKRYAGFSS